MQMVKKFFILSFLIWGALLVFMPKKEIYYFFEKELLSHKIQINEKRIDTSMFSLNIYDATIYVKGVKIATVKELNFFTVLFYSKITLSDLQFDRILKKKIPQTVEHLGLYQTIISPITLPLDLNGSFGEVEGEISLATRKLFLQFINVGKVETIQKSLKKNDRGWYYEKTF
jgi:hypothetical protein